MRILRLFALLATLMATLAGCGNDADEGGGGSARWPQRDVRIMAPADPGGGWDTTARAMAQAMKAGKVVDKGVEVYNVPGAGGTIGLSQLTSKRSGDPNQLMVMGLVMLGAIETNKSPVDLSRVTPIAALTSEPEAIVVPSKSRIKDLEQLVEQMKRDPKGTSFAGGSAGGTDQILMGLLAKQAGVDPSQVKYVAYSGGGEAKQAILSGSVDAGISGVSEFEDQIEAGKMRILAVSTEKAIDVAGKPAPTIKDAGLDVVVENWRGVVAPPGITPADRDAIVEAVTRLHDSPQWKQALEKHGWTDFFKPGDEFKRYLDSESRRVKQVLGEIGLAS